MMSFKGFVTRQGENRLLLRAHNGRGWIAAPEITIHIQVTRPADNRLRATIGSYLATLCNQRLTKNCEKLSIECAEGRSRQALEPACLRAFEGLQRGVFILAAIP